MKEAKEKARSTFGGLFGKVDMYGDKEGVMVYSGVNPKCFFDVKVRGAIGYRVYSIALYNIPFMLLTFSNSVFSETPAGDVIQRDTVYPL